MRKEKYNSDDDFIEEVDDSDMSDGTYQEEESDDNNSTTGGEEDIEHHVAVTPSPRRTSRRCAAQTNKRMSNIIQELSDDDDDDDRPVGTEGGQHKRKRTTTRRKIILDSSDEDSDGTDDDENENHLEGANNQTATNLSSSNTNSRTRQIQCDSVVDAKTAKPLPPKSPHVCYTDQHGDRHCYALNTMYRMAIENHVDGQKLAFLQPPYFDTPMSEDLEDQIACRFGRGALDIEKSKNYRKYYERFTLGLGRYDLYCCPICYNEADMMQGRGGMASDDDDDSSTDEELEAQDYFTFDDDPMTILAKVGCKVASSFCFLKVAAVRQHLKDVHEVDFEGLKGNDLLQRFKIRSADGLLQHYTKNMWGYWTNENAQTFRNLVQLVQDKEERKPEANPEFCTSFPNRAKKIWRSLRAPFLKHDSDSEEDDIINDDDDDSDMEENQVKVPIFVPPDQSEIEEDNEYVEGLKRRAEQYEEKENQTVSSESLNGSDFINNDSSSSAAESDDDEEDEPEDSWMAAKENQFKQQRKKGRSKTKSDEESDDDNMFQSDFVQGKKKRARFTANDDEEDNE